MVVKGRALGKIEIARRKALRKVGIGKPLFRGQLNFHREFADIADANVVKSRQSEMEFEKRLSELERNPDVRVAQEAALVRAVHLPDTTKQYWNTKKGRSIKAFLAEIDARKSGVRGALRYGLAGFTARKKVKNIYKLRRLKS